MSDIYHVISTLAMLYGLDPSLAVAVARVESELNAEALGAHGEVGLYQIKPSTAKLSSTELRRPWVNGSAAMEYMSHLRTRCTMTDLHFLVCYNAGPTRGKRIFPKQSSYLKKIMFELSQEKRGKCYVIQKF